MRALRHHFLRRRWTAAWLVALALLMRIAVPDGYMPMVSGNAITMELCSGYGPMKMAAPMAGMSGMADHHDKKGEHGKNAMPCGFSALSAPSLAGADPILLAVAIALVFAAVFFAVPTHRVTLPTYLRPPLRGPPTTA